MRKNQSKFGYNTERREIKMENNVTIKWRPTNAGNILFALYKGIRHREKATLTNDWQDRLEIDEYDEDVYDVVIVKPNRKEGHRDFVFHTSKPTWRGELTIEQWRELKPLTFAEIRQRLMH